MSDQRGPEQSSSLPAMLGTIMSDQSGTTHARSRQSWVGTCRSRVRKKKQAREGRWWGVVGTADDRAWGKMWGSRDDPVYFNQHERIVKEHRKFFRRSSRVQSLAKLGQQHGLFQRCTFVGGRER